MVKKDKTSSAGPVRHKTATDTQTKACKGSGAGRTHDGPPLHNGCNQTLTRHSATGCRLASVPLSPAIANHSVMQPRTPLAQRCRCPRCWWTTPSLVRCGNGLQRWQISGRTQSFNSSLVMWDRAAWTRNTGMFSVAACSDWETWGQTVRSDCAG